MERKMELTRVWVKGEQDNDEERLERSALETIFVFSREVSTCVNEVVDPE
jgi:hypothetical protein